MIMTIAEKLEEAALGWVGTPFCENSAVKGAGVCCHRAVAEVLMDAELMPRMELPTAAPGHARASEIAIMETWLDGEGAEWFENKPGRLLAFDLRVGDVLGFRLAHTVHHVAVVLDRGRIFHAIQNVGAVIAPSIPPQWARRLTRLWQPRALA